MRRAKPKPLTLFLVEPHDGRLARLTQHLAGHFAVQPFRSGKEALRLAMQNPPHLLMSNIYVPGVDGFSLSKILKEDPETQHVQVVLFSTTSVDTSVAAMATAAAACEYVNLIPDENVLLGVARRVLNIAWETPPRSPAKKKPRQSRSKRPKPR